MQLIPLILFAPSILLIAAAIIPAAYLLYYVYKMDRLEKEPPKLLLKLVLFGVLSTIFAEITEYLGIAGLPYLFEAGSQNYNLALYFIVIGLSEEGFKYLLLKKSTWRHVEFNCQFDGVVYAVFVSLGFALWENIAYVLSYGFSTAIARAVTAVPGHACFGVFMGAFYGAAKRFELSGDYYRSKRTRFLAVVIPMLLHGTYDYFASSQEEYGAIAFIIFVVIMFIFAHSLVKELSNKDRYIA